MTTPVRRPKDETARLGDEIYDRDIRPQVEAEHDGEYVAIDVDSGNWAVSDDLWPRRSVCGRCARRLSTSGPCGLGTARQPALEAGPHGEPSDQRCRERQL